MLGTELGKLGWMDGKFIEEPLQKCRGSVVASKKERFHLMRGVADQLLTDWQTGRGKMND